MTSQPGRIHKTTPDIATVTHGPTWFGTLDLRGRFMLDSPLIWFTTGWRFCVWRRQSFIKLSRFLFFIYKKAERLNRLNVTWCR